MAAAIAIGSAVVLAIPARADTWERRDQACGEFKNVQGDRALFSSLCGYRTWSSDEPTSTRIRIVQWDCPSFVYDPYTTGYWCTTTQNFDDEVSPDSVQIAPDLTTASVQADLPGCAVSVAFTARLGSTSRPGISASPNWQQSPWFPSYLGTVSVDRSGYVQRYADASGSACGTDIGVSWMDPSIMREFSGSTVVLSDEPPG